MALIVPLSDHPSDHLQVEADRDRRELVIRDCNGAEYARVKCPAVAAGADPVTWAGQGLPTSMDR